MRRRAKREPKPAVTTCDDCGKYAFAERRDARHAARQRAERGLREYRCEVRAGWWHLGHKPQAVVYGLKTAREVYGRSAP